MLPFTREELAQALEDGDVTKRDHPLLPLSIYNYSPEIQYTNKWNNVTRACRGLILDASLNIVARPWEKFFNLGQIELPIQFDDPVEVMDKADGSLGILYPTAKIKFGRVVPDGYAISTRGSFESDQARHGTETWRVKYGELIPEPGYTLLFEIVYPANRIVLDYDGMDDLVLLGAVQNQSGYYISPTIAKHMFFKQSGEEQREYVEWPGPVVEVYNHKSISEAIGSMGRKNKEGYVIRSHNFMVKVKEPDYIELHRLVTNVSPKTVWEQLKDGKTKTQIVSLFPDEFHAYVESMIEPLIYNFNLRFAEIQDQYHKVMDNYLKVEGGEFSRARYARFIRNEKDKRYFFSLLDGRSIRDSLWSELKPVTIKE
jgi:RNA ligase